jgi:hypothetical protein
MDEEIEIERNNPQYNPPVDENGEPMGGFGGSQPQNDNQPPNQQ